MYSEFSEMDGPCATIRCRYSKRPPKATWVHRASQRWVCFPCAQAANAESMRMGITGQYISSKQFMFETLVKG